METTLIFVLIYAIIVVSIVIDYKKKNYKDLNFNILALILTIILNWNIYYTRHFKEIIIKNKVELKKIQQTDSTTTYRVEVK